MTSRSIFGALGLALVAGAFGTACGGGHGVQSARLPNAPRAPAPASALRVPHAGGVARLYRVPGLNESSWKESDKLPPLKRLVGADLEQRVVYGLDTKNNLIGLDLESRRAGGVLSQIRDAAIGPDGAVYAVDSGSSVTQLLRRSPVRFRSKLLGAPRQLVGTMTGFLIAIPAADKGEAVALGADQAQAKVQLPAGDAAATYLGDLVAIAADSAVVLYEPQAKQPVKTIGVSGHARAVAFSPSGHRLYVARGKGDIEVIDRYSRETLDNIDLPGPAKELRVDFYGGWLLARPERGDSAWVVDLASGRVAGGVATRWAGDLPAVAGQQTLLLRSGADVKALDLSKAGLPVAGTVAGGANDAWLTLAWLPKDEMPQSAPEAADSAALAAGDSAVGGGKIYLQVSSSRNPDWANELVEKLKSAGLPASVLTPQRGEEAYRVVLGPYASREQAEATGKSLGMPSFVITPQDQPAR